MGGWINIEIVIKRVKLWNKMKIETQWENLREKIKIFCLENNSSLIVLLI